MSGMRQLQTLHIFERPMKFSQDLHVSYLRSAKLPGCIGSKIRANSLICISAPYVSMLMVLLSRSITNLLSVLCIFPAVIVPMFALMDDRLVMFAVSI